MYADKKGWDVGSLHVDLVMSRDQDGERIERTVRVAATIPDDQRLRLAEIAEKRPVTKT
jgi:putative redox protein